MTESATILRRMVREAGGVGNEIQTSAEDIAKKIGYPTSHVQTLRTFTARIGALKVRYVAAGQGNRIQGRHAFWTFVHDAEWVIAKAKGLGIVPFDRKHIVQLMPTDPSRKKPGPPKAKAVPIIEAPPEEVTKLRQELRKVRKSEEEALIEAARQYVGREAFITEELERFEAMGITIDASAIHFEKDEKLETAAILVAYIDRLKGAIERQNALLEATHDSRGLELKLKEKQAALDDANLRLERAGKAITEATSTHRLRMQEKDRRIKELEDIIRREATKRLQTQAQPASA